jgi:hypothetical protein
MDVLPEMSDETIMERFGFLRDLSIHCIRIHRQPAALQGIQQDGNVWTGIHLHT